MGPKIIMANPFADAFAAQGNALPNGLLQFLPIAVFLGILYLVMRQKLAAARAGEPPEKSLNWRGVILIAIALALIGLSILFQRPQRSPEADRAKVIATMESMFAAATNDDLDKWHAVATPDFYAFDNGKRFEGDALMELMKTLHGQGRTYRWKVTEPEVHINRDIAWITYVNQGSMQDATGSKDMTWLESSVLQKKNGGWRIQFFHSTRVP
jgi:ketosteroid isomerase-like protein